MPGPDQVVVILKAREPARIMLAIRNQRENRWHRQIRQRWVSQYNFYVNDHIWERMRTDGKRSGFDSRAEKKR